MERHCLTSGMVLHTEITPKGIVIRIDTPGQLWDESTALQIDDRLHDGIEYALAPFWDAQV
jgi:hypothetical protein